MNDFEYEEDSIIEKIKKYKNYIIFILMILVIFILSLFIINNNVKAKEQKQTKIVVKKEKSKTLYKVDIKGEILNPGVYELEKNSRVIDVIIKAGGFLENSDSSYINLSKKIKDEMVIIIYSKNYIEKYKEKQEQSKYIYIENECICPDKVNEACINKTNNELNNEEETEIEYEEDLKLIKINTATIDELQNLEGIGEAKAKNIIKYREEHGNFNKIEEIKNVTGIGESVFEKIKDNITL